jgi:rhamnogalacturonan acetylesterase
VIHTFPYYIQNAVVALLAKGAIPIVSSQTPDNIWSGNSIAAPSRFVGYAQTVSARTGVPYVDHYAYTAQVYDAIGQELVDTFYPAGHLHTSPMGANIVAAAFVRGLLCGTGELKTMTTPEFDKLPCEFDPVFWPEFL